MTRLVREGVRALVLDPEDRLLLARMVEPATTEEWWVTPGGGVDPGEEPEAALRRVLDALQTDELCPCNWQKGQDTLHV